MRRGDLQLHRWEGPRAHRKASSSSPRSRCWISSSPFEIPAANLLWRTCTKYKTNVTAPVDNVDPVRQKNGLSDVTASPSGVSLGRYRRAGSASHIVAA